MTWETRDPDLSSLLYLRLYECWLTHRSRASIAKRLSIPAKQVGKKTHFREH